MSQYHAGEVVARIWMRNDASGAPMTVADGDMNVLVQYGDLEGEPGVTFREEPAVLTRCKTTQAKSFVAGAATTFRGGCAIDSDDLWGRMVKGGQPRYDSAGVELTGWAFQSAGGATNCGCATGGTSSTWTVIDILTKEDCDGGCHGYLADVYPAVVDLTPAQNKRRGGTDFEARRVDIRATLNASTAAWGEGPGKLFPSYDADGNSLTTPAIIGAEIATAAVEDLVAKCGCKSLFAGCFITAAMLAAGTAPDIELINPTP